MVEWRRPQIAGSYIFKEDTLLNEYETDGTAPRKKYMRQDHSNYLTLEEERNKYYGQKSMCCNIL